MTSSFVDAFANQLLWSAWVPSSSELYWHSYNHSLVALRKPKYPSSRGHTYRSTNKHFLVALKKPKYWSFVGTHITLQVAIALLMFINIYLLGTKKKHWSPFATTSSPPYQTCLLLSQKNANIKACSLL
jgi:hypothetical protein